jgi:futalosine hydrolase
MKSIDSNHHIMQKRILLVAATEQEANAFLKIEGIRQSGDRFLFGNYEIFLLVTGVGSMATSWTMTKWFSSSPKPDLALNIGIAGSYREIIPLGEVVVPVSDCFADAGVETSDGFQTLSEAGLQDPDKFPFRRGKIIPENNYLDMTTDHFRHVEAITVNSSTGSYFTIERLVKKYNPDIETMEGATFFYICSGEKIPFLALRSVSNRVEPRNKSKWDIPLALENLSEKLEELLLLFD